MEEEETSEPCPVGACFQEVFVNDRGMFAYLRQTNMFLLLSIGVYLGCNYEGQWHGVLNAQLVPPELT